MATQKPAAVANRIATSDAMERIQTAFGRLIDSVKTKADSERLVLFPKGIDSIYFKVEVAGTVTVELKLEGPDAKAAVEKQAQPPALGGD